MNCNHFVALALILLLNITALLTICFFGIKLGINEKKHVFKQRRTLADLSESYENLRSTLNIASLVALLAFCCSTCADSRSV